MPEGSLGVIGGRYERGEDGGILVVFFDEFGGSSTHEISPMALSLYTDPKGVALWNRIRNTDWKITAALRAWGWNELDWWLCPADYSDAFSETGLGENELTYLRLCREDRSLTFTGHGLMGCLEKVFMFCYATRVRRDVVTTLCQTLAAQLDELRELVRAS